MYGINDLSAVTSSNGSFPLAVVYSQATGSKGATFGLLLILFFSIMICCLGTFLTVCPSEPHLSEYLLMKPGQSYLVGPGARQRNTLRPLLLPSQREAQLSRTCDRASW